MLEQGLAMNDDQTREKLRAALDAPPDPPLEATRKFLQSYCSDEDSLATIVWQVGEMIAVNPRTVLAGLAGIEGLLADQPGEPGTFAYLVAYDANWVLDDTGDESAKAWLAELATLVRAELESKNLLPSRDQGP